MTGLMVGLVALAVAVMIQRLILRSRARTLVAREQAFRFHAIRDELQLLALRGDVEQQSGPYEFLMWTTNLAIRNAGTMKLRDVVRIVRAIDFKMAELPTRQLENELASSPKPLQRLAADTFEALTKMLVANDTLVRGGLYCAELTARTWALCRPAFRFLIHRVDALAQHVAPSHAEAVQYARKYSDIADRFATV